MMNPFDEKKDNEKFQIFKGVTEAINDWMLKKYPEFDTQLIDKLKRMELLVSRYQSSVNTFETKLEEGKEKYLKTCIEQINDFLSKDYPDLNKSLKMSVKNTENQLKKLEKQIEFNELIKKDIKVYSSLCEDVYKMRDEFKEIQKFMENFKKKIQKAFEV